jgi:hypothetical protein
MAIQPYEFPDWVRGTILLGKLADGTLVPVLIDTDGNMNILLRGADALGVVRTVRVDNAGQLYAILRGANSNDVAVDGSGNLAAILKGTDESAVVRPVKVDTSGQVIMVPRGQSGAYMLVDASGFLSAILKGQKPDTSLGNVAVDASGQIIMVPRGQSGNYMAVDADGYLTSVLKGIRDGTLTTIGVDTSGRIEAFLMDGSDQWGQSIRVGNADLAARLGGLAKHDWRGQVVFQNDFAHGAHALFPTISGTGALIEITSTYWQTGGYALWMEGGSDASGTAYFYSGVGPSPSTKVGLAISFCVVNKPDYVRIKLLHETATQQVYGDVRLDYDAGKIQVYNGATDAWENAGDFTSYVTPYIFNNLKLVIDTLTNKYMRILYNDTALTPTTVALEVAASASTPRLYYEVWVYSHAGDTDAICLDNLILTVNEPA